MKVAIISGEIPTTTFIDRLVRGLAKNNISVLVCGNILKTPTPIAGVDFLGAKKSSGRLAPYFFWIKYALLLAFRKPSAKAKLDKILNAHGKRSFLNNALPYALVWHQPDIVHIQWAKGVESFMWVQEFGMKVVLSLRGAHINYSPISEPKLAETYRKVFPKIDGFHGVSKAICEEAAKYGANLERCQVAYSGFDLSQFSKNDFINDFETLKNRSLKIISVGRSHWKKGYHFALDAMAILKNDSVDFHYTIIGAAGNEELLFQKDQLGLNEQVTFLDKVPFTKVKQLIREADVLLLPSVEEGIANVVLEAMLLGTIVLTTNCGGMEESVSHEVSGFVVPLRDVESMAQNLVKIKNTAPQVLQTMVETAYENTANQHLEAKMVADMQTLYKKVAG